MTGADLGRWAPLGVEDVAAVFASAPFRWWISGGRALVLHLGRDWRQHSDTDAGVLRTDAAGIGAVLEGWDLHIAAAGRLTPWDGRPLSAADHENNVWCRRSPEEPWALDIPIGDGDRAGWIYRRDPSVRLPWREAVRTTAVGVPYLAPHVQLLFKSKQLRDKDHRDAREVIPELTGSERDWLGRHLAHDHPWQRLLAG